jgi:hypothetical protein
MKPLCNRLLVLLLCLPFCAAASPDPLIISRIRRQPVVSTNVAGIGYSRHLRALEIEFTRGAIYRFLDVPHDIYTGLLASKSKGHFINHRIRGRYRFVRVRPSRKLPPARSTQ